MQPPRVAILVEVVERPNGGISVVMADGQSSGKGAKQISSLVVRKVISLLSEGVRDGAAARAASDYLFTERKGKVSATLNIVSIDLQTATMVITRNNPLPVYIASNEEICAFDDECNPIGMYRDTRPLINEMPLEPGLTRGLIYRWSWCMQAHAVANAWILKSFLEAHIEEEVPDPQEIADHLVIRCVAA